MLKTLHKDDTTVTPYVATKDWQLSNVDNIDVILSEAGNPIEYEHILFEPSEASPDNSGCEIAKEDQSSDLALYREGLKVSGIFYPDLDPLNTDGTYKRMVYTQVKTTFYNNYRDPTKMWGLEKIDFDSSNTKKFLADYVKILNIPTDIMGEKIIEGTVEIVDNSIDDIHLITDDGQNNLIAGPNLFSKRQEIGDFENIFSSGSNHFCDFYFSFSPPKSPYALTASVIGSPATISLIWLDAPADGFAIERSFLGNEDNWEAISSNWENMTKNWESTGSAVLTPFGLFGFTGPNTLQFYDTNVDYNHIYYYRVYAFNQWGSSSYSNIASAEPL